MQLLVPKYTSCHFIFSSDNTPVYEVWIMPIYDQYSIQMGNGGEYDVPEELERGNIPNVDLTSIDSNYALSLLNRYLSKQPDNQ